MRPPRRTVILPLLLSAALLACTPSLSSETTPTRSEPNPVAATGAGAAPCAMRLGFTATDTNSRSGKVPVLGPSEDPARGPVLFAALLNVNTDGTRRSYSVDDPGGRVFALNNICNAMVGYCRGLGTAALKARFDQLREARDRNWPTNLLAATSKAVQRCWDGLTESALQHRVREVKRLISNGIRESANL